MKKLLLILLPLVLASAVFFGFVFFTNKGSIEKGALQVTAIPKSHVYLDDKLIGETPLCKCEYPNMLATGNYTLRLIPESGTDQEPFEEKVTIGKSVLTVVDRTFNTPTTSEGSAISLQPTTNKNNAEIFISSFPDKADVSLDKSPSGQTPLLINNTTVSDHELTVSKKGYKDKTIHVHTATGYRLTTTVYLGIDPNQINASPQPIATPSGNISPPGNPSVSPSVTGAKILILSTPTGFLRVRSNPTLGSTEIGRVNPGETYDYLGEQTGWYQITLSPGKAGWVSSQYARKQ